MAMFLNQYWRSWIHLYSLQIALDLDFDLLKGKKGEVAALTVQNLMKYWVTVAQMTRQ